MGTAISTRLKNGMTVPKKEKSLFINDIPMRTNILSITKEAKIPQIRLNLLTDLFLLLKCFREKWVTHQMMITEVIAENNLIESPSGKIRKSEV